MADAVGGEGTDRTAALIDRARRGDARAMEQLLEHHSARVYAHVARMIGPGADAEDIVQDACISAWRSIGSFEGTSFRAWLFRIATNRAIDMIRRRRRAGEVPLDPPDDDGDDAVWAEPADPAPGPAEVAIDREALRIVEEALGSLPIEQRTALHLRDVEGFDYAEIARIMASEVGTVKSRIHRGRVAVRAVLVTEGWGRSPAPQGRAAEPEGRP